MSPSQVFQCAVHAGQPTGSADDGLGETVATSQRDEGPANYLWVKLSLYDLFDPRNVSRATAQSDHA